MAYISVDGPCIRRQSNNTVSAVWTVEELDTETFKHVKVHWYYKTVSNPAYVHDREQDVSNYGEVFSDTYQVPEEANGVRVHLAVVYKDGTNEDPAWFDYDGNPATQDPTPVGNTAVVSLAKSSTTTVQATWTHSNTEVYDHEVILQGLYRGAWVNVDDKTVRNTASWSANFPFPITDYTSIRAAVRPRPSNGQWSTTFNYSNEMVNPAYADDEASKMAAPPKPTINVEWSDAFKKVFVTATINDSTSDSKATKFELFVGYRGSNVNTKKGFSSLQTASRISGTNSYQFDVGDTVGKGRRFFVRAINGYNNSNAYTDSDISPVDFIYGTPEAPASFTMQNVGGDAESGKSKVSAKWQNKNEPNAVDTFTLEYAKDTSFSGGTQSASRNAGESNIINVEGIEANIKWYFRMRSVKGSVNSAWTKVQELIPWVKPKRPSCAATMTSDGYVLVTVTPSDEHSVKEQIYRMRYGGGFSKLALLTSGKPNVKYHDEGTVAGGKYIYAAKSLLSNGMASDYSAYDEGSDWIEREPSAPKRFSAVAVHAEGSTGIVRLNWENTGETGSSFEIRYYGKGEGDPTIDLFVDAEGTYETVTVESADATSYEIGNLATAKEWHFIMRRVNAVGNSAWALNADGGNEITALVATTPKAPTFFDTRARSAYEIGETIELSWMHNNSDGSVQQDAEIQVAMNPGDIIDEGDWETIASQLGDMSYYDYTPSCESGDVIAWRVRTAGLGTANWSPWSTPRRFRMWAAANPVVTLKDSSMEPLDSGSLEHLPLIISASATADNTGENDIIEWHCEVSSVGGFEALAPDGSTVKVADGEVLYSKFYKSGADDWFEQYAKSCQFNIGAADMTFSGVYRVDVSCLTAQGLSASAEHQTFYCTMTGEVEAPQAAATVDEEGFTCSISPVCYDGDELDPDAMLYVYRIEPDGSTVLVAGALENDGSARAVDDYPNFGTCMYRVVAISSTTGAQAMTEIAVQVPAPGVYIQWDNGAVLLPCNLELSESYDPDVALLEFSGRNDPVAVFGTQKGRKATWKAEVAKRDDTAEVNALRELAGLMERCYVRELSGTGYPAFVKVSSISRTNKSGVVSVQLEVTRLES